MFSADKSLTEERDAAIAAKTTIERSLAKMGQDLAAERIRLEEIEGEKDDALA